MIRSPSRLASRFVLSAVVAVGLTGCDDASTGPSALVVAAETEAALSVSGALPTLPIVVERAVGRIDVEPEAASALEWARSLWVDAEAAPDPAAAEALRRSAYEAAAPVLARTFKPEDIAALRETLDHWVEAAGTAANGAELPEVEAALRAGAALLAHAGRLERQGRVEQSVRALLEASDRLRETTPRAVALRLIQQARERLASADADRIGEVDRRRAERLLNGAREALDGGDTVRAIRRAYYARQLLTTR